MKHLSNKLLLLAMVAVLISHTFLASIGLPLQAIANATANVFTNVELKDDDGRTIDAAQFPEHTVAIDSTVQLIISWAIDGEDVAEGESHSLQIPSELNATPQQGALVTTDNEEVGAYEVVGENITLTFAEEASGSGTIAVPATFNEELVDGESELSLTFLLHGESRTIVVPFTVEEEAEEEVAEETTEESTEELTEETSEETSESESEPVTEEEGAEDEEAPIFIMSASEIAENIITGVEVRDEDGNILQADSTNHLDLGDPIGISYHWSLPNGHGYTAGSTFTFQLPDVFHLYNDIENEPLVFNGTEVGTFTITQDGTVTMTFNEMIEQLFNINGMLQVWTEIKEDLQGDVRRDIVFEAKDEELLRLPIQFRVPSASMIDKQGIVDRGYNATEITWTVDFNKQMREIDNAVLRDPIQLGQALQAGSIEVYELNVQLNGSVVQGDLVDPSNYSIGQIDGDDFQINFGDIDSAYRVVFKTDITDGDATSYQNVATLDGDNIDPMPANASVGTQRGVPIAKTSTGYNSATQTISWEIRYNYNEKTIAEADAILTDWFTNSQELIPGSFRVIRMTIDENGNATEDEEVSNFTLTETSNASQNGFELQFNEDINNAYKIVYQTTSSERVLGNQTIQNTVETGEGRTAGANRSIGQVVFHKRHGTPNYQEKTIPWTITLNDDSYEMTNVTITDVFNNGGLTLIDGTFTIRSGSTTLVQGVDYTFALDGADGFTIEFTNPITTPHVIEYVTAFDYEARQDKSRNVLDNVATLEWVPEGETDSRSMQATAVFAPDSNTRNNGFKNGSYNAVTKEITWNIGVNYNLQELHDAVVEDFIQEGQHLVADSIEVFEMGLTGGANGVNQGDLLTEGVDYDLVMVQDGDGNPGFRVEFRDTIDSPYWISFKTSLDERLIKQTYQNEAILSSSNTDDFRLDAAVSVQHGGEYVNKSGVQDGRVIDWRININYTQSTVTNAKIVDVPSPNQILLEDSFQLFSTNVATNGTITKGAPLERGVDYILEIFTDEDGNETFELSFPNVIDRAYILEYKSFIYAQNNEFVSNQVSFEGDEITTNESTNSSESIQVRLSGGSGTGSGERGSIEVTKVDATSGETLAGATFVLYDSTGEIVLRTVVTGEDGIATFANLMYDDYILRETSAPEGYLVGINDSEHITLNTELHELTVENAKIIRDVQLHKIDDETGESLQGAVFTLQQRQGSDFVDYRENLETDENGVVAVEDLEPGDYQFVEVAAPSGYVLNADPIPFSIGEEQTEVIELTKENEIILGSVELVKVDRDDSSIVLEGAEFSLLDEDGNVLQTGLTTDDEGKLVVSDLRPGNYQFVETTAPEHYLLDDTPYPFTIVLDQQEQLTVTATNRLIPGSVQLVKVDADDSSIVLEGATFSLLDEDGNIVQEGLTTDANGQLIVTDLRPGNYQFVETTAPEDYILDATPREFTIERSQEEGISIVVENELIPGSVRLVKVDVDDPSIVLEGAEFSLLDEEGNILQEGLMTDENGEIVVNDLKPGNYQFVETAAPEHYLLNSAPLTFTIERSQEEQLTVTATNRLIPGAVQLVKVDADHPAVVLEGAEFSLLDEDGNIVQEGLSTDANGQLIVTDLRPGNYQFVETAAPEDYILDATPREFTIERSQAGSISLVVENELIPGSVQLLKVDVNEPSVTLEGAEFSLLDEEGNALQEGLTTDENGQLVVTDLKPGNYQFVETKAPEHYLLDGTPLTFTIERSQEEQLTVTATNRLIPGSVQLVKVDADEPSVTLEGAEFSLLDEEGNILQEGLTTNEAGELVVSDLRPGNYQFVETAAPEHYLLDETPLTFTIERSQEEQLIVTATNRLIPGSVQLIKVDSEDSTITLEGAEFSLLDGEGNVLREGIRTGENGQFVVVDLRPGDYQFIETKAPTGYELDDTPIVFTIEKSADEVLTLVVENTVTPKPDPSGPGGGSKDPGDSTGTGDSEKPGDSNDRIDRLPQTGEEFLTFLLILGLLLMTAGGVLLLKRRNVTEC
ncbi:SpaA isopeptide-forming pilin-related protein [Halalkalibacterium halodurans]|uniref:SpaA isopeptide-forming pilin-related protein n=1 Tax=Halalkalibacterium halodurans TaxID=86665 RepID=UPI002AA9B641|nr:SpaA isopeptide-forming pilin-related protein [Halalkalibacterium halodurans]MDY7222572.1 SpaA isopeptide-forming pilin-related protein [Halalkalibacterium halodurans]MDY7241793.1 SpaA isopeptide-forming pilin-related protein [Halalkalibacterium halodurans]